MMKRTGMIVGGVLVLLHASIGCGPFEYEDVQADSTTGSGGQATTGSGGQATTGSGGAPGYALQGDDGLVVRYFIDDDPGTPQQIHDSGPMRIDLSVESPDATQEAPTLVDRPARRGIHWPAVDSPWRARAALVAGQLSSAFTDTSHATIEAVASIEQTSDTNRIFFIGRHHTRDGHNDENFDDLSLRADNVGELSLRIDDYLVGHWWYTGQGERIVVHVTIDLDGSTPESRGRLFINGHDAGDGILDDMDLVTTLKISESTDLVLGNGRVEPHSIGGTIYYAALYHRVLTTEEIQTNAALLLLNDDGLTPGNPPR